MTAGKEIKPLMLQGVNNTSEDITSGNLEATFARGYTPLEVVHEYQGPVSIVGAGFSLHQTYKDIVGDVIACNSAHDFLISKGIIPKYAMVWDANPIMKDILKPHKDVTYLIASRCHPSVFKLLEGHKVLVWHALGAEITESLLIKHQRMEPLIAGGSSSVMRAMYVAGAIGYLKEMHLFGVCDAGDGKNSHVIGSLIKQNFIDLRVCGRWWKVAPWVAMQAGDFKVISQQMKDMGVRVIVHGKGFLPYCATFLNVETPDIKVTLLEKIRREVHAAILLFMEVKKSFQILGGSNVPSN